MNFLSYRCPPAHQRFYCFLHDTALLNFLCSFDDEFVAVVVVVGGGGLLVFFWAETVQSPSTGSREVDLYSLGCEGPFDLLFVQHGAYSMHQDYHELVSGLYCPCF